MSEEILHYGVKRRSGRYPWGSGEDPQRSKDILARKDELAAKGLSETQIAKELGMNTSQLRNEISWANEERKRVLMDTISSRKERGDTNTKIAEELGISESSVRNYLSQKNKVGKKQLDNIADALKDRINEVEYLDVGIGVERQMGISKDKMKAAIAKLEEEGYTLHNVYLKRLNNPNQSVTIKVLSKEKNIAEILKNSDKIRPMDAWTEDGGLTIEKMKPIKFIKWGKVAIRYGEDGGEERDGLIELRRGVKDLDLGDKKYAQVRIGVGDTHFLKGMAMYSDDLPDGIDIMFNTNKPRGTAKEKVLKPLKPGLDNPFGAIISRQKGALNIVNEEGDWDTWKPSLSAQFLSKQSPKLVKERLDITYKSIMDEYERINSLTNPTVKKYLMQAYSDGLDSKAQHLKVKGLPKTKSHVLLPFPEMNPNEVYAPNYKNGDRVVLIRYPHGGTFELPELTVNNKGSGKKRLGNAIDAIGIHPSVAQKLSGADFDGDTVYVVPNNQKKIKTRNSLDALKNFDPIKEYQVDHDTISPKYKQKQMGIVSNLITDMTIKGASDSELARAVKHSMVVIDSEKHKLDYKRSAKDNGIAALQAKYQTHKDPITGKIKKGASTIISQSKTKVKNVGGTEVETINPKTGKKVKKKVGGKEVALIDLVDDVSKLSSGTPVENLYVDYIKQVKALNNNVKKTVEKIPNLKRDPVAAKTYEKEVKSLDSKLNQALLNAPRERQAQLLATKTYYQNLDYDMTDDQKKKLKSQSVAKAREKVGAKRNPVDITDKEWEAIQKGAISNDKLLKILNNTNMDRVQELATPKREPALSTSKAARARSLLSRGYTYSEVAEQVGVSTSTLREELG